MMLVGAGLLVRGFVRLAGEEPGFRPERAVTVNVELPYNLYGDWRPVSQFYGELLDRLAARPGAMTFAEKAALVDQAVQAQAPAASAAMPE